MHGRELKAAAFVVMPYGRKRRAADRAVIDFDDIYERAIRPAILDCGFDVTRADEDPFGGFIHLPMFERLLLSDVVVADLTAASPNVYYELGIRHAARPRSTVLITAEEGRLPFDVAGLRAIPYRVKKSGRPSDSAVSILRDRLSQSLRAASARPDTYDSPLFQLISAYPGVYLPHDATDVFSERARQLREVDEDIRRLGRAKSDDALGQLRVYAEKFCRSGHPTETGLLVSLLLAFRDAESYSDIIDLYELLPPFAKANRTIREQFSFALGRRNEGNDARRAVRELKGIIKEFGKSPETLGILGRIHKMTFLDLRHTDPEEANRALDQAIKAYTDGFREEPRDYYPGINAATLNLVKGTQKSLKKMDGLLGPVVFAVFRLEDREDNYWHQATVVEWACLRRHKAQALRTARRAKRLDPRDWELRTTRQNLTLIAEAWSCLGKSSDWIGDVAEVLTPAQSTD